MINQTLKELEEKIKDASSIPPQKRLELAALLSELKKELVALSKTKGEEAESILGFTKLSAHEAVRREKNKYLLELSLKGLEASVEELEVSHPRLTQVINTFCSTLANLGI